MKNLFLLFFICSTTITFASIKRVNASATGSNNGTSWTNAYTDLQSALTAAVSGDQIWVAKGTYKPSLKVGGTATRYATFQMKDSVAIYGGFAGWESDSVEDHEHFPYVWQSGTTRRINFGVGGANETILSGDIGTENDNSDNCYHVFNHPPNLTLTRAAILDGFTIKGGNSNNYGGGMYNHTNSSPTLRNCSFISNAALISGGGLYFYYTPSSSIVNCAFVSNSGDLGGGVSIESSSPDITNCVFASNTAWEGGGMYVRSPSNPTLINCTFSSNAAGDGGGLYINIGSSVTLNNCIVWGNSADGYGDEIYLNGSTGTLNYSCYANEIGDVSNDYRGTFSASNNNITFNPQFAGPIINPAHPYALQGISPCTETGNNSYNSEAFDIRGAEYPRILNPGGYEGSTIDMGAYEYKHGTDWRGELTYYVRTDGNDTYSGTSWSQAFASVQTAITTSTKHGGTDSQIWIAKGTYKPTLQIGGTGERYATFYTHDSLSLYGGFSGTETDKSLRTNYGMGQVNETILSGDIGVEDDASDNCYHVMYLINRRIIVNGFTIKGGNANGGTGHDIGGGMVSQGIPIISNCIFTSNSATYGGGLYVLGESPDISNCIFTSNSATYGGAISSSSLDALIFNNCTITSNSAVQGGGMYTGYGGATLNNCIVWGNSAVDGDEIYVDAKTVLNYSCYGNEAGDIYGWEVTATNNNITDNPQFAGSSVNPAHPYSLLGTSRCIDAGNDSYNFNAYDLRGTGYPRKADKNSGGAGAIDMGAYEYKVSIDPLPVELTAFKAECRMQDVELQWRTEAEVNNYGFEVERRKAGNSDELQVMSWEKIGSVAGNGTSNSPKEYAFVDSRLPSGRYAYRLKQLDNDGAYKYLQSVEVEIASPKIFALSQNYPNPFNPSTTIQFTLAEDSKVSLKVFDMLGREMQTLVDGDLTAGDLHSVMFDASRLSSGMYIYRLETSSASLVKKFVVMR